MPIPEPIIGMPQPQAANLYSAPPAMMPQPGAGYPTSGPLSFGVSSNIHVHINIIVYAHRTIRLVRIVLFSPALVCLESMASTKKPFFQRSNLLKSLLKFRSGLITSLPGEFSLTLIFYKCAFL